jgi:hypothetical protein
VIFQVSLQSLTAFIIFPSIDLIAGNLKLLSLIMGCQSRENRPTQYQIEAITEFHEFLFKLSMQSSDSTRKLLADEWRVEWIIVIWPKSSLNSH